MPKRIKYMSPAEWNKLVLDSLKDDTMWKHTIFGFGGQETLTKSDDNKRYKTYIMTVTSDPNIVSVESF